jgi:membrane associated rhomboid family serine protease
MTTNYYRPPSSSLFPPVIKNLLIVNGIFFLATIVLQDTYQFDITKYLGLHYFMSKDFKIYQVFTYMFLHGGIAHILSNMFALWMFGALLENYWGGKRFIIFYLICGVGAALVQEVSLYVYFHHLKTALDTFMLSPNIDGFNAITSSHFQGISGYTQPSTAEDMQSTLSVLYQFIIDNSNTVGASGAIFGILLAFGMLFPDTMIYLYFAIPIKAKYFVMLYGAMELYLGIRASTGDNVAHFAHLGGLLFGLVMILYWKRKRTI